MKKICMLLAAVIVLRTFGQAFAHSGHHDHEEQYVIEEAARRDIKLISAAEAKEIAAKRLGSENIRFKEVELEDEHDDYPNSERFRPVFKIKCITPSQGYYIDVDASTGTILKFSEHF